MRYKFFILLAFGLLVLTQVASAALQDVVLYYSFEEKSGAVVKDLSGNGNNGIVKLATWENGKNGGGMAFLKGQCVDIPTSKSMEALSTVVSIAAWVKTNFSNNGTGRYDLIAGASNVPFDQTWGAESMWWGFQPDGMYTTDTCHGGAWQDGKLGRLRIAMQYKKDEWHHYAVTLGGGGTNRALFFDGKQVATDKAFNGPTDLLWQIGNGHGSGGGGSEYLDGTIDEVFMFNRAITEAEVKLAMEGKVMSVQPKDKLSVTWASLKSK